MLDDESVPFNSVYMTIEQIASVLGTDKTIAYGLIRFLEATGSIDHGPKAGRLKTYLFPADFTERLTKAMKPVTESD